MRLNKRSSREDGFTIIDLFVGIALSSIVAFAIISLFTSQQQTYSVQEQVAEAQQSARSVIDLLTRELRAAGNGVPNTYLTSSYTAGGTSLTVASTSGFSTASPYNVINITDPDDHSEAATIAAIDSVAKTITISSSLSNPPYAQGSRVSLEKISQTTNNSITFKSDITYSGSILTNNYTAGTTLIVESNKGFNSDYPVYINDGGRWEETRNVTGTSGSDTISLSSALSNAYPTSAQVNHLDKVAYRLSSGTLQRSFVREIYDNDSFTSFAENTAYLEFRYYDKDNTLLANPSPYTGVSLTATQRSQIRRIKVQVVVRTVREDTNWTSSGSYGDGNSYSDGYRRVLLESDIQLRNLRY